MKQRPLWRKKRLRRKKIPLVLTLGQLPTIT
jgi:hypothetical protein